MSFEASILLEQKMQKKLRREQIPLRNYPRAVSYFFIVARDTVTHARQPNLKDSPTPADDSATQAAQAFSMETRTKENPH